MTKKLFLCLLYSFSINTLYAQTIQLLEINDKYKVQVLQNDDYETYWEIRNKKNNSVLYNENILLNVTKERITSYSHTCEIIENKLVVSSWSGGAHCCNTTRFFEINEDSSIKFEKTIHGGNCFVEYKDNTITTCDNSWAYIFSFYAASPIPKIILDNNFNFSYLDMKNTPLEPFETLLEESLQDPLNDNQYIDKIEENPTRKIRKSFSYQLYNAIVLYIYSGKIDLAIELFEQYNKKIKLIFKENNKPFSLDDNIFILYKILSHAKFSPYYNEIKKLNKDNKYYDLL